MLFDGNLIDTATVRHRTDERTGIENWHPQHGPIEGHIHLGFWRCCHTSEGPEYRGALGPSHPNETHRSWTRPRS